MTATISDYYKCPVTLNRLKQCGHLSSYLDPFATWLSNHKYPVFTIRKHISNIAHFSCCFAPEAIDLEKMDNLIHVFLQDHLKQCRCEGWKHPKHVKHLTNSLNRFKHFLADSYGIVFKSEPYAYDQTRQEYLLWLSINQKLADSTIKLRDNYLNQFLSWYETTSHNKELNRLTPLDVERFFINATKRWGRAYKRSLQVTLRSFFDFCHEKGYIARNLRFALPVITTYRLSDVPKKIDDRQAKKLLKSIDRTTVSGKRTYAVLKLLYTYGVRGCQVRALMLTDIDWYKEEIRFASVKNSKGVCFPLFLDVGNALVDYIKNVRKPCVHKQIFLTLRAPYGPLTNSQTLCQVIREAMIKADIESHSKGGHCFRHGFVARMLDQGESFKHIADLVGHKHIQTTFLYSKIDFKALAEVALELPEVDHEDL